MLSKPEPYANVKARAKRARERKWTDARLRALDRDGWCCVRCHTPVADYVHECSPMRAHVNHIDGRRGNRLFDLANLETLCNACHMPPSGHARKARTV